MTAAGPMLWLDDRLVAASAARIDPADRGLLLGDGLFETLAVRDGAIRHAALHLARLREGAAAFGLPVPDAALLHRALDSVRAAQVPEHGALRLTLTRGVGPRGVAPPAMPASTLLVTGAADRASPPGPVRLCIATLTRRNEHSPTSRFKTLNYLDGILARREAMQRGMDDALLRNGQGRIAEASAANLLWRDGDGRWSTPPVAEGALPGIRRGLLVARGLVDERVLDDRGLAGLTAALLCNSLAVQAVTRIEDRHVEIDAAALARFAAAS